MTMMKTGLTLVAVVAMVTGCAAPVEKKTEVVVVKPATGNLTRSLDMVDSSGVHYGHVELDPVGGGKVYDADGRLIGNVVPPSR